MRQKINDTSLVSHPFSQRIISDIRPVIIHTAKSSKDKDLKKSLLNKKVNYISYPLPYSYFYPVFYTVSNLIDTVERLKDIRIHLRIFPRRRNYEKYGITRDKWIRYHYANFIVNIVSIYDIALILTNHVFRLGLPESKCKADVIIGNAHLTNTLVKKALVKLEQHTKPYREPRHLHVHRGELPELEEIIMLRLITSIQMSSSEQIIPSRTLNKSYSEASKNIDKKLGISNEKCISIIYYLFDSLLPIYESQVKLLPPSKFQNNK